MAHQLPELPKSESTGGFFCSDGSPCTYYQLFAGGGTPFICGGGFDLTTYYDQCYKYDAALDTWDISGTLAEARGYPGYGSSESWGLVIAGGFNAPLSSLTSVETTDDAQVIGALPDLPETSFENG